MKQYYYVNKYGQQAGPIPVGQFSACGIMKETLVWCEGMSEWKKAEEVEELKHLFAPAAITPPPLQPSGMPQPPVAPGSNGAGIPQLTPPVNALTTILSGSSSPPSCAAGLSAFPALFMPQKLKNSGEPVTQPEHNKQPNKPRCGASSLWEVAC